MFKNRKQAEEVIGGLSRPSKMPCYGYSISAFRCKRGGELAVIPGSVCHDCYARKGRYAFGNVQNALERRHEKLQLALSSPTYREQFVDAFVHLLNKEEYFRWHDSGDLQSLEHLELIAYIAEATDHVQHWLPTKETNIVRQYVEKHGAPPRNLNVRVSAPMVDGKPLNVAGLTTSTVISTGDPDCLAYTRGGVCGTCRLCWKPSVQNVAYPLH
jgi:hypothetical protein